MNHEEDRDLSENDDGDRLIIDEDDSEEERPVLETLILKKALSGYTVGKCREIKKSKEQPFNQEIIWPMVKSRSLTQGELSSLYTNYVEQSPFFASLKNIVQQSEASTSSDNCDKKANIGIAVQDPFIDRTSFNNTDDDFEDTRQNYLDSECMDQSLGGSKFIIKDCFFGEKSRNISELDGFKLKNSKFFENHMEDQFEEPILERLFSQVSNISQSSTITANTEWGELEFSDKEEENTETPKKQILSDEKLNIVEDGLIISKSDSVVYIIGSS